MAAAQDFNFARKFSQIWDFHLFNLERCILGENFRHAKIWGGGNCLFALFPAMMPLVDITLQRAPPLF